MASNGLHTTIKVPEGPHHDLLLEISDTVLSGEPPDPDRAWQATETAWRDAMPTLGDTVASRDARTPTPCCAG